MNKLKKTLILVLSLLLVMMTLTACGSNNEEQNNNANEGTNNETQNTNNSETSGEVKTGLAVVTSVGKSTDATGEEEGLAQADSVVVAVIVDEEDTITSCSIDTAQTKVNFNAEGKITTSLDEVFVGKQELGDEYGMKKASEIGKEWYEQANALADYVTGKTLEEVKGISVNEDGYTDDSELSSSVTMHVTGYLDAIEKAVNNATVLGASADDEVGLGLRTTIDKSNDATADEEGLIQIYSMYAAVSFDDDGVITSSIIDGSQSNINFTQEGKITTDLSVAPKTKNELGEEYGMKNVSEIGKEWDEQAAAYADYIKGKTVEEVNNIALDEGYPAEEELSSSVTIHVNTFDDIVEKAYNSIK